MLKRAYWNEVTAERELSSWRRSGLSLAAYARRRGVHPQRMYRWKRCLEGVEAAVPVGTSAFLPVRMAGSASSSSNAFEVLLGEPVRVRVPADFDEAALSRLLGVLSGC